MSASATGLPGPSGDGADRTDAVARALADGTRRRLLLLVRDEELPAGDLAAAVPGMSRPAVSQHLRVLQDAGLVSVRASGRQRLYRARRQGLESVWRFVEEMWSDRLDALAAAAERLEPTGSADAGAHGQPGESR
jgi:DNA-binding transcriptional ArsR family regulator